MKSNTPRDVGVGVGVGAFSGLMGVGGGIILMPYLLMVRKIPQKTASATSLVLVAMGAFTGSITYALEGHVAWIPAVFIVIGGLAGAWLGTHLVQKMRDHRIQLAFGVLLVLVAIRMFFSVGSGGADDVYQLQALSVLGVVVYVISGLAMGVLSALFGIGGGIIMVPILSVGFGYGQQLANGTSLAVMLPIALLGAIRLTKPGYTDWPVGLRLGIGAAVGAIVGAAIAVNVNGDVLRFAWAVLLLVLGVRMVIQSWKAPKAEPT